jgi:hypothetical protein
MIKVFFLVPTNKYRRYLRRYKHSSAADPADHYHNAWKLIDTLEQAEQPCSGNDKAFYGHPAWPVQCEKCNYIFTPEDEWQVFYDQVYKRFDNESEEYTLRTAPAGACWDAHWLHRIYKRPDGRVLMVKTPGGDWNIDGNASNCTRKGEIHECWVRHGKPEDGTLHVDKNGNTCAAGGGSILMDGYHGFLHNGHLVQC